MKKFMPYLLNGVVCIALIFAYHFYGQDFLNKQKPYYSVNFNEISNLKMAEVLENSQKGRKVNPKELEDFIYVVQKEIQKIVNGKPVFISEAFFYGNNDITEKIIQNLNLKRTSMYDEIIKNKWNE
jgi:hypothetical protein